MFFSLVFCLLFVMASSSASEQQLPSDDEDEASDLFFHPDNDILREEYSPFIPVNVQIGPSRPEWQPQRELDSHCCVRFTGKPGISSWARQRLGGTPDPVDYFHLFFDQELKVYIANQTNLYVAQLRATHARPKIFSQWSPLRVHELETWIGITIWMGIRKLPALSDYWVRDVIFESNSIPKVMSRERYKAITRALKLSDNEKTPMGDSLKERKLAKAHKFLPFAYLLRERFENAYYPHRELAHDELMTKSESKYGSGLVKVCKNIDGGIRKEGLADRTGYLWTFVYDLMDNTKTEERVLELAARLTAKGHHIFYDNRFTSPKTFIQLRARGHDATGTWRRNFGVPACLKDYRPRLQGDFTFASLEPFLYGYSWNDSKPCFFLTTRIGPEVTEVLRRKRGRSGRISVPAPVCCKEYNDCMGSIDQSDSKRASYTCHRK